MEHLQDEHEDTWRRSVHRSTEYCTRSIRSTAANVEASRARSGRASASGRSVATLEYTQTVHLGISCRGTEIDGDDYELSQA